MGTSRASSRQDSFTHAGIVLVVYFLELDGDNDCGETGLILLLGRLVKLQRLILWDFPETTIHFMVHPTEKRAHSEAKNSRNTTKAVQGKPVR